TGVLGVGFSENHFRAALSRDLAFIGCDAGSTDGGPANLGGNKPFFSRAAVKRDLRILVTGARSIGVPLLIAFLAAYLAERRAAAGRLRPIDAVPLIAVWGLTVLVVIAQRDLGAGVLLFGGALAVSYAATGNRRLLVLGVLLLLAAAVAGYAVFGVVRARVSAWLDPFADPIGGA
ncbi:MAG TPA: FtsW/RodA/SpoVE family cell cycle protein, partial [Anaerolineales bacterium]|nr:FtsW/RodA/SpoVE family cell cycle protein [Anaerolineales bacterium]